MRTRPKPVRLAVLALLLAFAAAPAASPAAGAPPVAARDHMVKVQGLTMHFRLWGSGRQTVVLEAGSGLDAGTWDAVAPGIVRRTGATVIAYDRAGMGASALPGYPYDVRDEVARLHQGLVALGRDQRLVLVGHSYGGYLITLYSGFYPEDVTGMVFVDANTPEGIDAVGGAEAVAEASHKLNDEKNSGTLWQANERLSEALVATTQVLRHYWLPCGVPVIALSAGEPGKDTNAALLGWYAGHERLARETGGKHRYVKGASHMVQDTRPDAIITAVADVVAVQGRAHPEVNAAGGACAPFAW